MDAMSLSHSGPPMIRFTQKKKNCWNGLKKVSTKSAKKYCVNLAKRSDNMNDQIDALQAARMAASIVREFHGLDVDGYSSGDLSALINCLFAIRRGKVAEKYGMK